MIEEYRELKFKFSKREARFAAESKVLTQHRKKFPKSEKKSRTSELKLSPCKRSAQREMSNIRNCWMF